MDEALKLQEEAYAAEQDPRRRSRKAMALAQSLLQLGRQHHQQQDPHQAIGHYRRAEAFVAEFLAAHPPERPGEQADQQQVASAALQKAIEYGNFVMSEILVNLGVAHNDMAQLDEALAALQRALHVRKDTVGKSHPSVAECLNNLGAVYFARGAHQKAAEHYEQALELLVEAAGGREEGAYAALTLYNIGISRAESGHFREAVVALKRAERIAEQSLGTDHRQVELIKATLQQFQRPESGPPAGSNAPTTPMPPPE